MEVKIDDKRPSYVGTGRILDENGAYVAGTKTKEQAIQIVEALKFQQELINKFAQD